MSSRRSARTPRRRRSSTSPISPAWAKASPGYYSEMKSTLKRFVDSGQLGIFANAYWGNPAYKLPPAANLMAVAHYLEALSWQKEIVKIHTIFGGKNPHPNYLVGGMPCAINLDDDSAIGIENLNQVKQLIQEATAFVQQVYIPDLLAIASFYPEWTQIGGGLGSYLVYGDLPQSVYGDPEHVPHPARRDPGQEPLGGPARRSLGPRGRDHRGGHTLLVQVPGWPGGAPSPP